MKPSKLILPSLLLAAAILTFFLIQGRVPTTHPEHHESSKSRVETPIQEVTYDMSGKPRLRQIASDARYSEGARIARERTEQMRDAGVLAKKGAPNYVMIGQDGRITNQAVLQSGLKKEQIVQLQTVIDRYWRKISDSLADRAVLIASDSDPQTGDFSIMIPALPDGGNEVVSDFENDIRTITGTGIGNMLLGAFDPGSYVGGFGKYEIRMKVATSAGNSHITEFEFLHPETGIVTRKGSLSQDYSYQYFGNLLESPKFKAVLDGGNP